MRSPNFFDTQIAAGMGASPMASSTSYLAPLSPAARRQIVAVGMSPLKSKKEVLNMERFDVLEQEQLAAQVVAVVDAHFHAPTAEEKQDILTLARQQINSASPPLGQADGASLARP